jgi:hypothetical protein
MDRNCAAKRGPSWRYQTRSPAPNAIQKAANAIRQTTPNFKKKGIMFINEFSLKHRQ